MIGHYSRLRDVTGQSHPIYPCTRANHARVINRSTLHFAVARNIVYNSNTWEKNLTGRKCQAYRTISYKIRGKIALIETAWT